MPGLESIIFEMFNNRFDHFTALIGLENLGTRSCTVFSTIHLYSGPVEQSVRCVCVCMCACVRACVCVCLDMSVLLHVIF